MGSAQAFASVANGSEAVPYTRGLAAPHVFRNPISG